MTPLDDTHKGLLLALSRNTNDKGAILAYSDFLMEIGSPGWIITRNYRLHDWPLYHRDTGANYGYKLCWLDGYVPYDYRLSNHHLRRAKYVLKAYAEGNVQEIKQ